MWGKTDQGRAEVWLCQVGLKVRNRGRRGEAILESSRKVWQETKTKMEKVNWEICLFVGEEEIKNHVPVKRKERKQEGTEKWCDEDTTSEE